MLPDAVIEGPTLESLARDVPDMDWERDGQRYVGTMRGTLLSRIKTYVFQHVHNGIPDWRCSPDPERDLGVPYAGWILAMGTIDERTATDADYALDRRDSSPGVQQRLLDEPEQMQPVVPIYLKDTEQDETSDGKNCVKWRSKPNAVSLSLDGANGVCAKEGAWLLHERTHGLFLCLVVRDEDRCLVVKSMKKAHFDSDGCVTWKDVSHTTINTVGRYIAIFPQGLRDQPSLSFLRYLATNGHQFIDAVSDADKQASDKTFHRKRAKLMSDLKDVGSDAELDALLKSLLGT